MSSHSYPVARLTLCGEIYHIGIEASDASAHISLRNEPNEECFMTVAEAKLMVAALETAIDRIEDGSV